MIQGVMRREVALDHIRGRGCPPSCSIDHDLPEKTRGRRSSNSGPGHQKNDVEEGGTGKDNTWRVEIKGGPGDPIRVGV